MSNYLRSEEIVANKQYNTSQQYILTDNGHPKQIPELKIKSQLNKIIVNSNGKPDHLAINLYWDTFRSWYNPNKGYTKNGNLLIIKKLKSKGIYINYQKLSDIHGVSKETVRKKIVKLEQLGLINRSFQHKETITTKLFNQLIIYVWKNTPHFFNALGIDKEEITSLTPYTSHNYVADKHNIIFCLQGIHTKANFVQEGVLPKAETKELNKPFSKEKDRSITSESNFYKNSFKKEESIKKVIRFNRNEIKELKDFYPLNKDDCYKLQSLSGREFSLNSMNEILLDMSKRLTDRYFKSRKAFLSYMGKVFCYEKRDVVKINNDSFKIRNNLTLEEIEDREREKYLSKIEESQQTSQQGILKKRLAAKLVSQTAYELLQAYKAVDIRENKFYLYLSAYVVITAAEKEQVLQEIRSIYRQNHITDGKSVYTHELQIIMPAKPTKTSIDQNKMKKTSLPVGIWGRVRKSLIEAYGEATDSNWFSKLTANIDEQRKELKLKAPTSFVKDWIETNYFHAIEKVVNEEKFRVSFY